MIKFIKRMWLRLFSKKQQTPTVQILTAQLLLKEMEKRLSEPSAFAAVRDMPANELGKTITFRRTRVGSSNASQQETP